MPCETSRTQSTTESQLSQEAECRLIEAGLFELQELVRKKSKFFNNEYIPMSFFGIWWPTRKNNYKVAS